MKTVAAGKFLSVSMYSRAVKEIRPYERQWRLYDEHPTKDIYYIFLTLTSIHLSQQKRPGRIFLP